MSLAHELVLANPNPGSSPAIAACLRIVLERKHSSHFEVISDV